MKNQHAVRSRSAFRAIAILLLPLISSDAISASTSETTLASVCAELSMATVRIVSVTDTSSGVIITAEGHVLTVAHGLHREHGSATVIFHDGTEAEAEILQRDTVADVALLKVDNSFDGRRLPNVGIGLPVTFTKGESVLAAGYPGRERNGVSPVIRLGELLTFDAVSQRSSCILTAGDSGGPLVNLRGQLIGLHRQIGLGAESNHHITVAVVAEALKSFVSLESLAIKAADSSSAVLGEISTLHNAASKVCRERTVEIHQGQLLERVALGTILDKDYVATKLSELTPDLPIRCLSPDGSISAAEVLKADIAMDVAILTLEKPRTSAATLPAKANDSPDLLYSAVFAATGLDSVSRPGLLTREKLTEPSRVAKLGAVLEFVDSTKSVRVKEVAPNGAAGLSGLHVGDRVIRLSGRQVHTLEEVSGALQQFQPGDCLRMQYERDNEFVNLFARLQHDPSERFERTEFLDGRSGQVSDRRSGFESVLQHDVPLTPNQCGGPLCDVSGRLIAINIARRARESTLAAPIDAVLKLINE